MTENQITLARTVIGFALLSMFAACSGGGDDDGVTPPDAPSSSKNPTSFTWTIERQGSRAACATVGANEVRIIATPEDGLPIDHTFQCVLVPGSFGLAPGRYAISAELYDGTGPQRLSSAAPQAVTVPATGTPPTVQLAFVL